MVFNAIFNNCSVISWHSALLVEETGENQRPVAKSMTNYHVLYRGGKLDPFEEDAVNDGRGLDIHRLNSC
jgi:hypothetical protein